MVLTEVCEALPAATAAAAAGFPDLAAGSGRGDGGEAASGSVVGLVERPRVGLLYFLREGSGTLERIVHLRDLLWVIPYPPPGGAG